jgi:hypothetical protein
VRNILSELRIIGIEKGFCGTELVNWRMNVVLSN